MKKNTIKNPFLENNVGALILHLNTLFVSLGDLSSGTVKLSDQKKMLATQGICVFDSKNERLFYVDWVKLIQNLEYTYPVNALVRKVVHSVGRVFFEQDPLWGELTLRRETSLSSREDREARTFRDGEGIRTASILEREKGILVRLTSNMLMRDDFKVYLKKSFDVFFKSVIRKNSAILRRRVEDLTGDKGNRGVSIISLNKINGYQKINPARIPKVRDYVGNSPSAFIWEDYFLTILNSMLVEVNAPELGLYYESTLDIILLKLGPYTNLRKRVELGLGSFLSEMSPLELGSHLQRLYPFISDSPEVIRHAKSLLGIPVKEYGFILIHKPKLQAYLSKCWRTKSNQLKVKPKRSKSKPPVFRVLKEYIQIEGQEIEIWTVKRGERTYFFFPSSTLMSLVYDYKGEKKSTLCDTLRYYSKDTVLEAWRNLRIPTELSNFMGSMCGITRKEFMKKFKLSGSYKRFTKEEDLAIVAHGALSRTPELKEFLIKKCGGRSWKAVEDRRRYLMK